MLPLTDPLWDKLDSGFSHRQDVPRLLLELAEAWDKDKATSFFRDALFDESKGICYGATYAALPHLLKLAEPDGHHEQRGEIALFLGFIALGALGRDQEGPLPGLPEDPEGWDSKLDGYRACVAAYEDPSRPIDAREQTLLPRYKAILAIDPMNAADLEKITSIRVEYLSSLPRIGALCERALLESIESDGGQRYLLSGIAATDGLLDLSLLLNSTISGWLKCAGCDWSYQSEVFGERIAIYADPPPESESGYDRAHLDFMEESPSRADGFIIPAGRDDVSDPRVLRLLALADRLPSPEPAFLLRHFLGHIQCCKCGMQAAIRGRSFAF